MIVKNESKIITRLFDSVLPIIDTYCICDTGSTDNTIEVIENYFSNKNIPGKIVHEPFTNFCHNRNFALKACLGLSDFILLLDADMIIELNNFDKSILNKADNFRILQGNDSFYYQNMRIIKNNSLYKYVGVTHEYIDIPPNTKLINLKKSEIFIKDIGDGGAKNNKYERDIFLLQNGLKEEPNNSRYHFYLANSYFDLKKYDEAIEFYHKRIKLGGWKEEVWFSYYRIGLCYKNQNKFNEALGYWLEGYEFYPERLEGIYEIIKHYRIIGKQKLSMIFYNLAKTILNKNEDRDEYLFLNNDVYTFKIFYEFTIIAAYCGFKNIDNEFIKVFNNSTNNLELNNLLSNYKFYKHSLPIKTLHNLNNSCKININNENLDFNSTSSCLIKKPNNNGFYLNIRYVNWTVDNQGNYNNCDKHIISVNKFQELDNNLNLISEKWLDFNYDGRKYIGVEDVRIFYNNYNNKLIYLGTGFHSDNKLGVVSGDYDIENNKLEICELKQNFKNTSCEKNWVFIDYKNNIHIVYNWFPIQICKLQDNNELILIETRNVPNLFSYIRGSTCGYNFTNSEGNIEIWFINHIVSYEKPRYYYHLITVFDKNMNLLKYSAPFKFEGEPIEYCLSIIVETDTVIINYSIWDRTTKIAYYDKNYIDSLLKYNN